MSKCDKSRIGCYECQVVHKGIGFDGCLFKELKTLWDLGIETIGSCCGKHKDSQSQTCGFIQVKNDYINQMLELGYIPDKNYQYIPRNSFICKTNNSSFYKLYRKRKRK